MKLTLVFLLILASGVWVTGLSAAESRELENWLPGISERLDKAYALGATEDIAAIRLELLAAAQNDNAGASDADLVDYYVAMTHYREGLVLGPQGADDLQACIDRMSQSTSRTPDFAEGHILLATCAGALIPMRPEQVSALSEISSGSLAKSAELAPDNPRLSLTNAINLLFTPPQFGGGREPALEMLNASVSLFQASRQDSDSLPRWGLDEAYTWRGIVYALEGRHDASMAELRLALSVNPDSVWVKDVLMPRVANGESLAPMLGM